MFSWTTKNLELIVGGGVCGEIDNTREALLLLNQNYPIQFSNSVTECQHLLDGLRGKATILPAITYLISDECEEEGK
jgi:hypothetical protein